MFPFFVEIHILMDSLGSLCLQFAIASNRGAAKEQAAMWRAGNATAKQSGVANQSESVRSRRVSGSVGVHVGKAPHESQARKWPQVLPGVRCRDLQAL